MRWKSFSKYTKKRFGAAVVGTAEYAGRQAGAGFYRRSGSFLGSLGKREKQADRHYATLSEEQKLSIVLAEMEKQRDCAGLSAAEKMAKLDEKTERHREQEKSFPGANCRRKRQEKAFLKTWSSRICTINWRL